MATYTGGSTLDFNPSDLWVANAGESSGERFEGLKTDSGALLLGLIGSRTQTYSELVFESNGLTYRYIGNWTITVDANLVTYDLSAQGSYSEIRVEQGSNIIASYTADQPIEVDFGSQTGLALLGTLGTILQSVDGLLGGLVTDLLGAGGASDGAVANLHTDATPGLVAQAFDGSDRLQGGALNDTLVGHDGNDTLIGGVGADEMSGGLGDDVYYIDNLDDVVIDTGGNDRVVIQVSGYDLSKLSGIETIDVQVGTGNDTVDGSDGDDSVGGGTGNDTMNGGAGNDTLDGGAGSDNLSGGIGDDVLSGGDGNDYLAGDDGNDSLNGGAGNDVLDGGAGNDTLFGGSGDDAVSGGDGNDVLYGEDGNDVLNGAAGNDVLDGGAGNDILSGGIGDDTLSGGEGHDHLSGDDGNDVINGNAGNDTLVGGSGTDTMSGGLGDDTYHVDAAGDQVVEGLNQGTDTVYSWINYALTDNAENLFLQSGRTGSGNALSNVIYGNESQNSLAGRGGDDEIHGRSGNDYITGYTGNDRLYGDSGRDNLYGNSGNDFLAGGISNDTLSGHAGNDTLDGGYGRDNLSGGAGRDVFVFKDKLSKAGNLDRVMDFNSTYDSIQLDNRIFTKIGNGTEAKPLKISKAFFTVGEEAKDSNDYLIYNKKTGYLYYDKDGSGSAKAVEIAKLSANLKISYHDFYVI